MKLGFENFYLYSSINPLNGHDFTLIAGSVNTACLNIFLTEFSKERRNKKILLVLDGAPWHRSAKLKVPHNIELVILPPYSPELNPVERFWRHLKAKTIKNKIYEDLESLQESISLFFQTLKMEDVKSLCSIDYL